MIEKVNLRDSYKYYLKVEKNPVDIKVYLYIVIGFISFFMKKVLEGWYVQLAGGQSLGTIGITGKKKVVKLDKEGNPVNLNIDYGATNKMWADNPELKEKRQYIYHLNEHSNGVTYTLKWWKAGMKIGNKRLYFLDLCKPQSRKIAKMIFAGKEYLVTH